MESRTKQEQISVIIPVYNVAPYLDQCLESVCGQTYRNLEILLIDDGSTDESGAICDMWAEKDARIRVIHKENGGVSSARNEGLKAATGTRLDEKGEGQSPPTALSKTAWGMAVSNSMKPTMTASSNDAMTLARRSR